MGRLESAPMSVSVNKSNTTYTESGAWVSVIVKNKEQRTATNGTAVHEAQHIVAAEINGTSVVKATIVRSGDALGSTQLSRPDPVAAMAPHSVGSSGTSWDVFITRSMGANPDAAASAGRTIVTQNSHMVNRVALELEDRRTIYNGDIRSAMGEAAEEKAHGPSKEIAIFVKSVDGKQKTYSENSFRGEVILLPNEEVTLNGSSQDEDPVGELFPVEDQPVAA